jgi:cytoskeletal protein CcmA (bactofilin family)
MASKLFSRIVSKLSGKKAAKRSPIAAQVDNVPAAPLSAPAVEQVTGAAVQEEEVTPLSRQERETNFNPVLLKAGNITNHLSPGTTLTGDLVLSQGGIRVQCSIHGSVTQESTGLLIIDKDAVITGTVRAKYLLVLGEINGDLEADRVVIAASARIFGDITYRRSFGSVTGAKIRGRITEVEQKAVVHHMTMPTPAPEYGADSHIRPAPTTSPSPSLHDDEDDVYGVGGNRHKVFAFPVTNRDEEMESAMPEVRYAVR